MGVIRKAASILTLGGVSYQGRQESQAAAAKAQAVLAGAEAKIAEEQAAVIARALREDLSGKTAGQELGSTCAGVPEQHPDTEEVTGSNPVRPTILRIPVRISSDYATSALPLR